MGNKKTILISMWTNEHEEMKQMAVKLYEEGIISRDSKIQFVLYAVRMVMDIVRQQSKEITELGNEEATGKERDPDDSGQPAGDYRCGEFSSFDITDNDISAEENDGFEEKDIE